LTDEMGHTYNWMSEKYEWGIEHVFNNLQRVLDALSEEYVVIISSDHGGGGSNGANNHGSQHANDMTIPFFMYGEGIEVGVLNGVSILDIAPTVVEALGVTAETYWVGNDLTDATPVNPDIPVIPDDPTETKVGTIEYGISVWDGNKIFSCTNGVYEFAAKIHGGYPKQYVYIPYDGNYTTLSFALHSKRDTIADRFQLGFNGKVYTYNAADNSWYDENNEKGNITMKTENGEDVNLGTFVTKQDVDGETVYNWVVFTIEDITTNVEIIHANLATHSDGAHFGAKDIIWSGAKVRPEDPEAAAFDVLASQDSYVNVPRGSVKSVTSTENTVTVGGAVNPENGNTFSAFGLSKKAVDTWLWLGFKYFTFTVGLSADEGATVPTNLYIYEWEEAREYLIAEADYIPNNGVVTFDLQKLKVALDAQAEHPYLIFAFTINGDWVATGADAYLTFSNIIFSTTVPTPEAPVECEHNWTDATCATLKTCSLCGETEGELAAHTYGNLIPEIPATETAAGTAAHYFCDVCDMYFDVNQNETTLEDLTIEYVPEEPELTAEEKAFNVLASEDSYADVYLGNFKSVTSTENTVTVGGTVNTANGNAFSAFGLKKDAVEAWLALGYKFFTFTVEFSADEGATVPTHLYIFEYTEKRAFLIADYSYVASNRVVTLALETLKTALDAETEHPHLIFAFTINGKWEATGADGYLTFSNIEFSETAPATAIGETLVNGGGWAVGFDDKGWGQYWISSTQEARAIVEYKAGYNALTFKMKGDWAEPGFAGVFKLRVDAIDYEYKKVGDVWGWYNGEVINTNIAMYDENGDVMDISSLNTMPAGGWPWVTFVITGIGSSSNVEIISMNENSNGHPAWGPIVTLFVKNIVWSFEEVSDPVIPEEPTAEEKAFEILASADSYVNVPRGSVKSVTSTENTVTVGGAVNPEGGNTFSAFGLSKTAVEAWLNLDMKYLTFTIGLSADEGATAPTHIYMYDWAETMDFVLDWEPLSYIPNGTTVTFNLEKLNALLISEHPYLIFAFTNGGDWVPTGADAYFTFSGVKFSATAPAPTGPKAGTLEYGVSLYNGSQVFWWNQGGENEWQFAATPHGGYPKQYVYVPYEDGYNTLTVTLGSWRSYFASSFKLGYNGKLYAYNATENAWFDEEGNKGNITVKTESGEDINLAMQEGADSQPWVVFTIEGITTDLEIVYVFANSDVHLGAKDNMVWSVKES